MTRFGTTTRQATWEREARWLRFSDPDWERRFRDERYTQSQTRVRVMLVVAIVAVVGMGWGDVLVNVRDFPEYVQMSLVHRFFYVVPIWFIMLVATGWQQHQRFALWFHPVGTVVVMWALAILKWRHGVMFHNEYVANGVFADIAGVMLVSVFTLPMLFRAILGMIVIGCLGIVGLFYYFDYILPQIPTVAVLSSSLAGTGMVVLALAWHREVGDRRDFAQREIMAGLNRELGRLNAEKNEFMAAAAHDLRSPLAAVRGLASQMRLGRMEDPERKARALSAIDDLSGRMLEVVNNYLGEHALESGTLPVRLEQVDLRKVISAVADRHGPAAATKEQQVLAPVGAPVWGRADASLLGQVLDNFVSNALKFSPRGATVRLALAESRAAGRVRVEVIDAGPGIGEADRAKLFRKYSGSGARPTGGESSHGIGLAVAKRVAEAMGGEVGCDSEPGAGATFWIALPTS